MRPNAVGNINMWLALLKNPLTKLVAEKTIGAVTHKLKRSNS